MIGSLKLRVIIMTGGSVIGLAGAGALTWASVVALAPHLGLAMSGAIVGGILMIAAAIIMWKSARPAVPMEEEFAGMRVAATNTVASIRDDTLNVLAEVSITAVSGMVQKRPLLTLLGVGVAAYTVARAPKTTASIVDRMLSRMV